MDTVKATQTFAIGSGTINETELTFLDGATAGTVVANKAVIAGPNLALDMTFGDITNISTLGGGVDSNAVKEIANLDVYWSFEDDLVDSSGNSHPLELSGGTTTFAARGTTKALVFNGSTDYTAVDGGGNYKGVNKDTAISISFWFKGTSATGNDIIFAWGNSGTGGESVICRVTTVVGTVGGIQWAFGNGNVNTDTAVNDGEWHHIVVVWKGDTGGTLHIETEIYVDGVSDNGVRSATNRFSPVSNADFMLGDSLGGGTNLTASLDEFAIYDGTALSAAQVLDIFNRQRTDHITLTGGLTITDGLIVDNVSGFTTLVPASVQTVADASDIADALEALGLVINNFP